MQTRYKIWKGAHIAACLLARQTQHDVGIWRTTEFGEEGYNIRTLPRPENRYGHELQCEVVTPKDPL